MALKLIISNSDVVYIIFMFKDFSLDDVPKLGRNVVFSFVYFHWRCYSRI